ncbi:hypothetical protein Pyn_16165 [Prunus yedoensis var. nudiflora]|uniref:Uncharacterized protein n=1 Tax=Prunus yedoensis var. nudiflora TaxID=2094558 RepID=A0A314YEM7_PRUYE|nr:hypothetical protein Pyn_16165 [Prunus yedoensis var. nudiflora]
MQAQRLIVHLLIMDKHLMALGSQSQNFHREEITDTSTNNSRASTAKESTEKPSVRSPDNQSQKKVPVGNHWDSHQTLFDMPTVSTDSQKSAGQTMSPPSYVNASPKGANV